MAIDLKSLISDVNDKFESFEGLNKVSKYFRYGLLVEAEIIATVARKVQQVSEDFVKSNSDNEYEKSISDVFDGFEKTIKDFAPQIEKVTESVNKIKDNIVDFSKRKKA